MPPLTREQTLLRKVYRACDSRHLKLTLMPTEQCNFRCTYCYEDFVLGIMPRWVIDGLKALMTARAPELNKLDLRWFGGEPMMAYRVIAELCRHAQALRARHPQLTLVSSMTTNGYLLGAERFEELLDLDVRQYQISLDGYGEDHDRSRRRRDGAGTFERIWQNLLATRGTRGDFSIMLRIHFTPSTLDQVKKLAVALNAEFGSDDRYRIFFKAISRLGGANDDQIERASPAWQASAIAQLSQLIRRRDDVVIDPAGGGTYVCYAAEPNSLVVRSNGALARCTVAFNDPRNQVGWLQPDGTLSVDHDRSRIWFEGLETLDPKMLHCPLSRLPRLEQPLQPVPRRAPAFPGRAAISVGQPAST